MHMRILCITILSLSVIFGLQAEENRRDGGNRMRGGGWNVGGLTGAQSFDELSLSEKQDDLEQAAFLVMLEDVNAQLAAIRSKTIVENASVMNAHQKAVGAQLAFLGIFENIPELKTLAQQRDELDENLKAGDWSKMRELYGQIRDNSTQQKEIMNNNESVKALLAARIEADSAFTIALREALADIIEYQELKAQAKQITDIQKMIREVQMAERMGDFNRRQNDTPKEEKQEEKKAQDLKEF